MDGKLVKMRSLVKRRRNRFIWISIVAVLASVLLSWMSVDYLNKASRIDPAIAISELKSSVRQHATDLGEKSEDTIRNSFKCAQKEDHEACAQEVTAAVSKWRLQVEQYDLETTKLAMQGVQFDKETLNFNETYDAESPLRLQEDREFNRSLEFLKLLPGPLILLIFTWLNTFFVRQLLRYDSLLLLLCLCETDDEMLNVLLQEGRLLDHLSF